MRGCAFEEGVYPSDTVPCPGVEIRLTSDFWLRENEELAPHARAYAASPDLLNEVFGKAYHKITHAGLDRCGMTGGACASGTTCVQTTDASGTLLTEQCEPDGDSLPQGAAGGATKKKTTRRRNEPGLIVAAAVSSVATLVLAGLVAFYACRRPAGRDLEGPVEIKTPPHEETKHSA